MRPGEDMGLVYGCSPAIECMPRGVAREPLEDILFDSCCWWLPWRDISFLCPTGPRRRRLSKLRRAREPQASHSSCRDEGIVRSRWAFEALKECKKATGDAGTLKAGEYRFDHPATLLEVYDRLRRGDVYTRTVVIPEGFNIFDVANAVAEAGITTHDEFLEAERQHTELITRWSPGATSLEGYLFPDTYKFSRHAKPEQMLSVMVKRFAQQAQRLGLSPDQVQRTVTMASLVEKEVHIDEERPEVASVFENRLAAGLPLQTDPRRDLCLDAAWYVDRCDPSVRTALGFGL
jgi:UPF0755 protein